MADNYFGITDPGKVRENNEDTFIAQKVSGNGYIIACVIDGVGGYAGGEIAAEIARETILSTLAHPTGEIIPLLTDAFTQANSKIWQEKEHVEELKNMACVVTLALVDIAANQFYYAHIGDTRLYLSRDGSLVKISHDQSFVGFLEDSGRLSEEEAIKHPKRNEIDKALGFKNHFSNDDIETGQSPFLPGDMLLLCSDGLTDMIDKETISHILKASVPLKSIGSRLIDAANDNGGRDNVTVVLVKNDKSQQQHPATKPAEIPQSRPVAPVQLAEQTVADQPDEDQPENKPGRSNKGILFLLIILVLALAAVCVWQYLNSTGTMTQPVKAIIPKQKNRNAQEIKLQTAIDSAKGHLLILSDTAFKSPVLISQPIIINRDSLHIKAKGTIAFAADSGFSGPAIIFGDKAKNILLDSVSFKNFGVAIVGYNNALGLKNIRFFDCKAPVQNAVGLVNNKYINGTIGLSTFKTDSLPKTK